MSNLNAPRSTWTPKLDSSSLRRYRWWRQQTGNYVEQENFCHFWRVVLIWVPMLKVGNWLDRHGDTIGTVLVTVLIGGSSFVIVGEIGIHYWSTMGWWSVLLAPLTVVAAVGALLLFLWCMIPEGGLRDKLKQRRRRRRAAARNGSPASKREHGGFANFFILIGQIIRVKKQRVCPLVEIPPE